MVRQEFTLPKKLSNVIKATDLSDSFINSSLNIEIFLLKEKIQNSAYGRKSMGDYYQVEVENIDQKAYKIVSNIIDNIKRETENKGIDPLRVYNEV